MFYAYLYIFCFAICLITMAKLYKLRRSDNGVIMLCIISLMSFWIFMEAASFFVDNKETILLFQHLKYISIIMLAPLLILNVYAFIWKLDRKTLIKLLPLFIVPILTGLSIFTNGFPFTFITKPEIYFLGEIPKFRYVKELGYYIHMYYSYILVSTYAILLLYKSVKSPKIYKIRNFMIFIGVVASLAVNVLFVNGIFTIIDIDTTSISLLIAVLIFYWGVYILPKRKIVPYARNLVIENMSDIVIITDNKNDIIDVNPTAQELLSIGSSIFSENESAKIDFRGMSLNELLNTLDVVKDGYLDANLVSYSSISFMVRNKLHHFHLSIEPIFDEDEEKIGTLYILYDITELQHHVSELVQLNGELKISDTIINEAREAIAILDSNNIIIRVNKSLENMSGYSADELIGSDIGIMKSDHHDYGFYRGVDDTIKENGLWEGEVWDRRKNGMIYPKWMSTTAIKDENGQISHYISISSDISKLKKAEKDIHLLAFYDTLTGLPNRTLFNERLEEAIRRCKKGKGKLGLFYIDLGRFKLVNDTYGHDIGDELLVSVSNRIKQVLKKSDILFRLGSDEFTLIIEDIEDKDELTKLSKKIISKVEKGFRVLDIDISVLVRIGIAMVPDDDVDREGLIRKADAAMYQAKSLGGSDYVFSSEELEKQNREINKLEIMMKEAVKNEDFELYLQAQVACENGETRIAGAEALIRWPQEDGSMISPFKFIGLAEKNGLINPIGIWVMEESFRIGKRLMEEGIDINLAFNVSIRQFESNAFYIRLKELVESENYKNVKISVEITESLFFEDVEKAIESLTLIKNLGIKIALDDFGTGFSSMSYLNRLPIDYLKIDKSFIDQLDPNSDKNLANLILSMAKTLQLKTVAEGIEEKIQSDCLFESGCDFIQGYYYSKPIKLDDFIKFEKEFNN